jgi:hypothetical protein
VETVFHLVDGARTFPRLPRFAELSGVGSGVATAVAGGGELDGTGWPSSHSSDTPQRAAHCLITTSLGTEMPRSHLLMA